MASNGLRCYIEELGDLGLGSPNGVGVIVKLELNLLTASFVNHDLVIHGMLLFETEIDGYGAGFGIDWFN